MHNLPYRTGAAKCMHMLPIVSYPMPTYSPYPMPTYSLAYLVSYIYLAI